MNKKHFTAWINTVTHRIPIIPQQGIQGRRSCWHKQVGITIYYGVSLVRSSILLNYDDSKRVNNNFSK